jgi:hypothetical protein
MRLRLQSTIKESLPDFGGLNCRLSGAGERLQIKLHVRGFHERVCVKGAGGGAGRTDTGEIHRYTNFGFLRREEQIL